MESPASAAQPSSKMSGFTMPRPPAAPVAPGFEPEDLISTYQTPELSAEDARALASEGVTGDDTEALRATQAKQAKAAEKVPVEDKALSYEERVKLFGMSIDEALKIIDALTTIGDYEEELKISKSVSVVLATRSTRFNSYLADKIDIADPRKVGKLNQLMAEYQVAASLTRYNKTPMPALETQKTPALWEKSLESRLEFVRCLPSPVFLLLTNKLAKFDAKMLVVFSEGYEQNF
jgi:hypothetical protein